MYAAWGPGDGCLEEGWERIKLSHMDRCVCIITQEVLAVLGGARGGKRIEDGLGFSFNLLFPGTSDLNKGLTQGKRKVIWKVLNAVHVEKL